MVKNIFFIIITLAFIVKTAVAYADSYTGKGVTIAVIDSGINSSHPQLKHINRHYCFSNNWDKEKNYQSKTCQENYNGSNNLADHGTHVAGIIAAQPMTDGAPTGVAPQAEVVNLRVLHDKNNGSQFDIAEALKAIIHDPKLQDVKIVNMSLGSRSFSSWSCVPATESAHKVKAYINKLTEKGVIVVAASGNESYDVFQDFPACLSNVIAVGVIKSLEKDSSHKQPALLPHSEVLAPGFNIVSTNGNFDLADKASLTKVDSGTSMATPVVSGCIALMAEKNPHINTEEVKEIFTAALSKKQENKAQAATLDCMAVLANTSSPAHLVSNINSYTHRE